MNLLFSCLYWLFVGLSALILYVGALLIWLATAWFDRERTLLHRYTCWWSLLYLRCLPGCRIRVDGREKIRPGTTYVLVANHQSLADIMALSALAVDFKWVSKKEVFRIPCVGWNMLLNGYVRVDRGNLRLVVKTMVECRRLLERGVSLMMFPEGHRSPTGEIQKFHAGSFKLAAECGCAVIPIVVDGTLTIFRGLRVKAFPGTVTIRVLDPLTLAEVGGKVEDLREQTYLRMQRVLAEIRGQRTGAAA